MTDRFERVQVAQWILDKQLGWIAAADSKVAVIVALDTAVFATLATAYASAKAPIAWASLTSMATGALLVIALAFAAMSLFPRTDGPKQSRLFFGPVATESRVDYTAALVAYPFDKLHEDIAAQIHRNAEIAKVKHRWVRRSMGWSFFAAAPWAVAVYLLVKQ